MLKPENKSLEVPERSTLTLVGAGGGGGWFIDMPEAQPDNSRSMKRIARSFAYNPESSVLLPVTK